MAVYNLGYAGDMAYNLFRLKRDILPVKPTALTECMGMNDAGQRALVPKTSPIKPTPRFSGCSPWPNNNSPPMRRGRENLN